MNAQTLLRRREGAQTIHLKRAGSRNGKPAAHGATWTSERVEQLKACIGAGLSCSQIAVEIGVSRNAVIGKMSRLRLSRPREVIARKEVPERPAWRGRSVKTSIKAILGRHQAALQLASPPQGDIAQVTIQNGRGCSLLELGPGKCRWPVNEPGAADFCFCGNQQVDGLPYCLGHARMAYKLSGRTRD